MARPSTTPAWQIALLTLTSTVVGLVALFVLYWAQAICIPIALAIFFTFLLSPLVSRLNRAGLGRTPAVLLVVFATASAIGLLIWFLGAQATNLAADAPQYTENVKLKIERLRQMTHGSAMQQLEKMVEEISGVLMSQNDGQGGEQQADVGNARIIVEQPHASPWTMGLPAMLERLLEDLTGMLLVLVLVVFMLAGREDLRNRLIRLVGRGHLTATTRAFDDAARRISHYLLMQLAVNGAFGLAIMAGLLALGVPYAVLWGFLAFLLRYLPYIGPWIAAAPPILVALITASGWMQPLMAFLLFLGVETVVGNVVEPRLYGRSIGVSEVAVLVSAAFWAFLWGPIGLVLSNPLTVCLVVLGKHVPRLAFLDILLGDEPALAPHVAFYQRLLAHDKVEAQDLIRKRLADTPPQDIYDEILAPAIAFAKRDADRDELSETDEEFVLQAADDIRDMLAARLTAARDVQAAAAESNGDAPLPPLKVAFLGCPARDRADRLALLMLRDLLDPSKWELEISAVETLTSEILDAVARRQPAAVCIGSLRPGGLAHTRYLCKRLRARFPDLKIIVGRWGMKSCPHPGRRRLVQAGADRVGCSLLETRAHLLALRPVLIARQRQAEAAVEAMPAPP